MRRRREKRLFKTQPQYFGRASVEWKACIRASAAGGAPAAIRLRLISCNRSYPLEKKVEGSRQLTISPGMEARLDWPAFMCDAPKDRAYYLQADLKAGGAVDLHEASTRARLFTPDRGTRT